MTVERKHSRLYEQHLQSEAWKELRRKVLARASECCERCGMPGDFADLQVHHLTYVRLGRELLTDLQVVCLDCHQQADRERAAQTEADREEAQWYGRLNAWASKVYGDDWEDDEDYDEVEEAFDRWLARRGESR